MIKFTNRDDEFNEDIKKRMVYYKEYVVWDTMPLTWKWILSRDQRNEIRAQGKNSRDPESKDEKELMEQDGFQRN